MTNVKSELSSALLVCLYLHFRGTDINLFHRLERVIRELAAAKDYNRVQAILEQLCNEYAYAVHQPHARNGGLIGLAAAGIALGGVSHSVQPLLQEKTAHLLSQCRT